MATYATAAQVRDYVQDNRSAQRSLRRFDDDGLERLLLRAQRAVDTLVGGGAPDPVSGLRLDPATLTAPQATALQRATCAWVEWALMLGLPTVAGDAVDVPEGLAIASPAARQPPQVVAELAGYGLLKRSATVQPDPPSETPGPLWLQRPNTRVLTSPGTGLERLPGVKCEGTCAS